MITASTLIPTSDPVLRKAIYKAFGGRCFYTQRAVEEDSMHIDHIVPRSRGGMDSVSNYVLSSGDANFRKGASTDPRLLEVTAAYVSAVYAEKVIEIFSALNECGQYPRPIGRPPLPESKRRTARINQRTYPDVEAIFKRMGPAELEREVRAWAKRQEKR